MRGDLIRGIPRHVGVFESRAGRFGVLRSHTHVPHRVREAALGSTEALRAVIARARPRRRPHYVVALVIRPLLKRGCTPFGY